MLKGLQALQQKQIYEILDGDTKYVDNLFSEYSLKYLSGPDICKLSSSMGFPTQYTTLSRWQYMESLIIDCIKYNKVNDLLTYLFIDVNQVGKDTILENINKILHFSDIELSQINKQVIVKNKNNAILDFNDNFKAITNEYINSLFERCKEDFDNKNYDSVLTKSRTLIEEVLIFTLETKDQTVQSKGNYNKLYQQFKEVFNMKQSNKNDNRINDLLSGLEKIIGSICDLRNLNSDSHGAGKKRIGINEKEARLVVNSSVAFCSYILDTCIKTTINK